jgi:hypothetical protein
VDKSNVLDWSELKKGFGVLQKGSRGERHALNKAAAELPALDEKTQRASPALTVATSEDALADLKGKATWVALFECCQFALDANELATRVVALCQPVRVHQPRPHVLGVLTNGTVKRLGWIHHSHP